MRKETKYKYTPSKNVSEPIAEIMLSFLDLYEKSLSDAYTELQEGLKEQKKKTRQLKRSKVANPAVPIEPKNYTEADLDDAINEVLDEQLKCRHLPLLTDIVSSESGRVKVFRYIKHMIFIDGITDIYACLAHIECEAGEISCD